MRVPKLLLAAELGREPIRTRRCPNSAAFRK